MCVLCNLNKLPWIDIILKPTRMQNCVKVNIYGKTCSGPKLSKSSKLCKTALKTFQTDFLQKQENLTKP